MKKVSIILPTYCESGNIDKLILSLIKQLKTKSFKLEIVVVDDNSPDGTAKNVQKLINKKLPIKLHVRKNQRGLATAIHLGIKKSQGEIIILMDTDFNHKPQDVPRLIQPILNRQADLVIGSRYIPGGGMHLTESNKLQFFLSRSGNLFVNKLLLRLPIHESLSGFIAFKRSILTKLNSNQIFYGYGDYCIRLLFKTHQKKFRVSEIPVVYGDRHWGESKTKLLTIFIQYFISAIKLKLGF